MARTKYLILSLLLLALVLGYFRLTAKPPTTAVAPVLPNPTASPVPIPTPTPIATSSAILNPQTNQVTYINPRYSFSFEYASHWHQAEYAEAPQPIVLLSQGNNQDVAAFTVTLNNWPVDSSISSPATGSAWSYNGWQGTQTQTKTNNINLTLVSATKASPTGQIFRILWVRSLVKGNNYTINTYLKPLLKSFRFL